MTIKESLKQYITADFDVGKDIYLLRKLVLIHTLLLMIILLFSFFTLYNMAVNKFPTATLDAIAFVVCAYAYFQLRKHQRLELAINVVVGALFIFFNALAAVGQNESYTLIWTIFFPIFVILLKGRTTGLRLVALYYAVLIPQAFFGIDHWQNGAWDFSSFVRFSIASLVVVYSAYFNEFSFERSYGELNVLRKREKAVAEERARMMEELIERKNQLLADVSHELRTPIAVLKANLEALEDGVYDNQSDAYNLLHKRLADMNRLIDDLNQVAAADIGGLMMQRQPIAIAGLVDETIKSYQPVVVDQDIAIRLNNNIAESVRVSADRDRLIQVISNLMNNTCRYTDRPGLLQIDTFCERDQVVLRFADSAPGVADEELPKLFERLYRVESSRSRATGGSGLGLAICKSIIEAHRGSITASASQLGGICVEIRLPIFRRQI